MRVALMCHEGWVPDEGEGERHKTLHVPVGDEVLPAFLYEPPSGVPVIGGCVVATDIYGTIPFYRHVAQLLAGTGCLVALVDTFFREGELTDLTRDAAYARRARMDECQAIQDTNAALDFVKGMAGGNQVAIVGFCLGGLFALDLAAERTDLIAVSFYGFPEGLPGEVRVSAPRPIDRIEQINGPILAFWGDLDHVVPVQVVERFDAAMARRGIDYESHRFPEAGHGFLQGLVEDRADSHIAEKAWARTVEFLATGLTGRAA